ncbi:HAD hydrolase-like protein [Arcanobacterium haemolyticum]|nr:HAD hydrolase-like protein [Arcanobacterium haemolyticum]
MKPVLFDFDGTLANSGPIITASMDWVMKTYAGIDHGPDFYLKYVGPPLPDTFTELGVDVARFTKLYRERYMEVMYGTPLFPGVADMLRRLYDAGVPMAVATSKRSDTALALLEHHDIARYFMSVCGSAPGTESGTKADRVREALTALEHKGINTEGAVMVGDRIFDITGAAEAGLPCILVRWGEAPDDEFAHAWRVAETVGDLEDMLRAL